MNINTVEVIDRGMKCLSENLGPKETEIFIATILKERFDYTQWRHTFVDEVNDFETLDKFVDKALQTEQFAGDAKVVL